MCIAVFGTKPLDDHHTGANIAIRTEETLSTFDISVDKVIAFVHDSGANINNAGQQFHDKYGSHTEACTGTLLSI